MMGCRPQQLPELAETTEGSTQAIRVSDQGWLVFTDQEQFISTMQSLFQDRARLESYDQQHGYTAYFNAWRAIGEEEYETLVPKVLAGEPLGDFSHLIFFTRNAKREWEEQMQISHPILQFLTNEKGILQVGDSVKKFSYDWAVSVPMNNPALVTRLENTTDFSESFWHPFRSAITRSKIKESEQGVNSRAGNNLDIREYEPGNLNLRRIRGLLEYQSNVQSLQVVSSETKHQRRISGVWVGDEAPTLIHRNDGYLIWGDQDTTFIDVDNVLVNEKSTPSYGLGTTCPTFCIRTDIDITGFHGCGDCDGNSSFDNQTATTTYVMPWP